MRVLQVTSHLNVGGITTSVVTLAETLVRRGHDVVMASSGGALEARLTQHGIAHWPVPLKTSAEVSVPVAWTAWHLGRQLAGKPVDLLHAHTRVAQVVAHWLWRRLGIPYVTTWHGFYRRRFSRRLWPCTGLRTIAISTPVEEHLQQVFKLPPQRVCLIPHGVDVARFAQPVSWQEQAVIRQQAKLPSNGPVVGTIVRLVPEKGVGQLLEAFAHVRAQIPQAKLLVVGDGAERSNLEHLADQLGMTSAVHFSGSVLDTRVALAVMDVFVFLPAIREGFGLSLLEAMASGRPIVAVRRGGGSSWVLEESRVGMLVDSNDPQGLGETIVRLLRDPVRAGQLAQHARLVAQTQYDLERMVTQVEAVYAACLRDAHGSS